MVEEALEEVADEQGELAALGLMTAPSAACALSARGCVSDMVKRRWKLSDMAELHDLDHFLGYGSGFLLLDELREDGFEIGQTHESG